MSHNMTKFKVSGMSCAACSARVQKAVAKVVGVTSCDVNLLTNSMNVTGDATPEEIIMAVQQAGYGASLQNEAKTTIKNHSQESEIKNNIKKIIASFFFLLLLLYLSMGKMFGLQQPSFVKDSLVANGILQMLLAMIVIVINQKFFISGVKAILHFSPNMDTLVSLGSGVSFIYSVCVLIVWTNSTQYGSLYFESSAMIVTLISVGKLLESIAKGKTTTALESLAKLTPANVIVVRNDNEISIPIENVVVGDIFVVKPGQNVAVDGIVVEGFSAVNESSLTGESIPKNKQVGDEVYSGTLNMSGHLKCRATRVGQDSTVAKFIQMVTDASSSKAPIAKVADKVSGVFVPTVIGISLLTFVCWLFFGQNIATALTRAINVLIISCPCALGLATPVAIMVGVGVGAKNGILYKNAQSLELAGKVKTVVLDKTGTVTNGSLQVVDIASNDKQQLLQAVLDLENKSEHPVAISIVKYALAFGLKVNQTTDFENIVGFGVKAVRDDHILRVGNVKFIANFVKFDENTQKTIDVYNKKGYTCVVAGQDEQILGVIAVADSIKDDSKIAIAMLNQMKVNTVMISGDSQEVTQNIASQIKVNQAFGDMLPKDKARFVNETKSQTIVAMVGDGINDSVALTTADIGMAIGTGADVAVDAANIVLVKNSLIDVVNAISLGRVVLHNIYVNLFWAFFYNCLGIPLAAGVFTSLLGWSLRPEFCALAMSLSSFCVVSNALLINTFKIKNKTKTINTKDKQMTKTIKIEGMMCGHCEARVKKVLEEIDGVTQAIVSHTNGTAIVTSSIEISDDIFKSVIEAQGYKFLEIK